jgi:hypothetical protein
VAGVLRRAAPIAAPIASRHRVMPFPRSRGTALRGPPSTPWLRVSVRTPAPLPARTQKSPDLRTGRGSGLFEEQAGDVVLSHQVSPAVPSALRGLTTVFGMGTGVALAL